MPDLLVLGAGPAGLAAARQAARRGFEVTVLERAPHVGGLSASLAVAGQRVDLGSHRLHPSTSSRVLAELQGLLGADLQSRRRHGRLRLAGRWVGFPLQPAELLGALPPRLAAGIAHDALTGPVRRRRTAAGRLGAPVEATYAAYLTAGLGPSVYDALYGPFAVKLWGLPGERIHADQARVRVTAASPLAVAARLVRGGRTGRGREQGRSFLYPRRGFGQVSEVLADAAVAAGADLRLGVAVTGLATVPGAVRVQTAAGALTARHCFSTLPAPVLAGLAGLPSADPPRMRGMALVYLAHDAPRWTEFDAHYLPQAGTPVTRLSEPKNYRDSAEDPPDRTVLCAELPCDVGDTVWSATDDSLVGTVLATVAAVGLPPVRLAESRVVRLPAVYPVYDLGYRERLAAVPTVPGVVSFGRLGLFAHDNSHHAMLEGFEAVDCLGPDGGFDDAAWAANLVRYAAHRVED